jgi:DNA-binding NtrC family response regulator
MPNYDIIMVEDDPDVLSFAEGDIRRNSLTFMGVSCLKALEDALKDCNAQLFAVDGNFPHEDGDRILYLAPEAIDLIRKYHPDAKIAITSADNKAEATAREKKVEYVPKDIGLTRQIAEFKRIMGI